MVALVLVDGRVRGGLLGVEKGVGAFHLVSLFSGGRGEQASKWN